MGSSSYRFLTRDVCAHPIQELVEEPILFVIPRSESDEESAFGLISDRLQIADFARDDNSIEFFNNLVA